jgi:hypothetical protein
MTKRLGYVMLAIVGSALALGLISGCDDGGDSVAIHEDRVTFVNDYGQPIVIQPFDAVLFHGESADFDIGGDIVHVVVFRESDGLVLLEVDVEAGEVWVVQ